MVLGGSLFAAARRIRPARGGPDPGRGELLQFGREVQKVVISEPKIADAVVVSPHEVMVNAKAAGRATVLVWETGATPVRYNVTVRRRIPPSSMT